MSFRAIVVKAKQIAGEMLRRRVLLAGKQQPRVPGKGRDGQAPGLVVQARPRVPDVGGSGTPFPRAFLRSLMTGQRAPRLGSAVGWRRGTAVRLVESRSSGGTGRGGPWAGGSRLPAYAFLGLSLAAGSGERSERLGLGEERDQKMMLPLETCCNIIRGVFKRPDPHCEIGMPTPFPSDLASYEISPRLLGKGACSAIYAVRMADSPPPRLERAVSETSSEESDEEMEEEEEEEEKEEEEEEEEEDEETKREKEEEVEEEVEEEKKEEEEEDIAMETWREDAISASDSSQRCHDDSPGSRDGRSDLQDDCNHRGDFNLALKMMFNYGASTTPKIYEAFGRECLPLWSKLDNGAFGLVRWENGHRAKDKSQPVLPAHPNLLEVHHAFVGPTAAHQLDEARSLFPAALPPRLHGDGMGMENTLYLVMRRYDMTLAEYNHIAGPPRQSRHVAMVMVAQLLEGVAHLVHHGIAHRDLKSDNILVELRPGSPRVVIADFGFCLAGGLRLDYPDRNREIGGNSALMAPEVKLCAQLPRATIDYSKSDGWAVGAIAYEILGLPNPFCRRSDGGAELESGQYEEAELESGQYEEADLPGLPDDVPPGLAKTIRLLLRKDPCTRPSASVAATLLHLFLWQPPVSTFATWEWSGQKQMRGPLSCQQQLATWLLHLSAGLLCQRSFRGGRRSWLDETEYGLCMTFMSRVTSSDLLTAANHLLR